MGCEWWWGMIFRMILDSAYVSVTLKTFPQEVEPEPAITLRTLKGRTEGALGTHKVLECDTSPLCTLG